MTTDGHSGAAAGTAPSPHGDTISQPIKAVRLRHPWRTVIAIILIVYLVAFIWDAAQRSAFQWDIFAKYVFDQRIPIAAVNTLLLTLYSMIIAAVLALILAVMRLSDNPVFKSVAWFYLWIFRGTPVYVQLVFWGLLSVIYPTLMIGLPFLQPVISLPTQNTLNFFTLAVIGLGLNEAAYLAEIIRAGILSVDRGQEEAATALGMSWSQTMWRIVIPQSMRIIIPPTGNEVISMLKTTSLVTAVPYSLELFTRSRDIATTLFAPIPLLLVASVWYLAITSVLMIGQYFLEKRFSRGIGARRNTKNEEPPPVLPPVMPTTDGAAGIDLGGKH
ncbi:amino acid ABC transporter permease [Diaminobutyricibacter tongyongensis]|uniref:Amino acid ABC transporter permease n=1 Tax=Leifsonia tongyongensis TaxID=1268043 RepID=A0A6L9Y129_9MICO|nr:amino acid ABC transporter permease [Diaminobutyricibacter tongyongensis]NEN07117.1 amino acid ABC transporter permease [Diaminobutyricibacter tongyongensis]